MSELRTLPAGKWEQTLVVQKSRFMAFAARVTTSAAAQEFIQHVALPDATHHCYAYVTTDGQKSCDNGEPSGTAGIPILQAIKKAELSNVVVVVERYFGGIKLGTGGLARAYGQAASQVLDSVTPVWLRDCTILEFHSGYEQQMAITKLVPEYGQPVVVEYQDTIRWRIAVPVAKQTTFVTALTEIMRIQPEITVIEPHVWVEFSH